MCMDLGHWEFPHKFNVDEWFGFVYRITEKSTNRQYLGKKQFWIKFKRPPLKGRKNKRHAVKESLWKEYTGSSERLNEAIAKNGMDNYSFEIESLHESKSSLHYAEVKAQVVEDVMVAMFKDGTPKYYNGQISATKFRVKPLTENEQKMTRK